MKRKILFIVCDNGLGHTRRSSLVANRLSEIDRDLEIHFLANPERMGKFKLNPGILYKPIFTNTSAENLRADLTSSFDEWLTKLPDLSAFDLVVSDNLESILEKREDAVLMGSFLWFEVLKGFPPERKKNSIELLTRARPRMLGSLEFAGKEIPRLTEFNDVGLLAGKNISRSPLFKRKNALLSSGLGGEAGSELQALLLEISKLSRAPFPIVFGEPSLLPKDRPDWLRPASFDPEMYEALQVSVIRPGMGTLTDSLTAGSRIFSFFEEGNQELTRNAKALEKQGVGEIGKTAKEAWNLALSFSNSLEKRSFVHENALNSILLDGVEEAALLLRSYALKNSYVKEGR